jgi:hypothetical protein
VPSNPDHSAGGYNTLWLLGPRYACARAGCDAHSNQDFRSHLHFDACHATHSDLAAGADIDARAHYAAADPNGPGSAYAHASTADRHLCSAATSGDGHAQATTTH